MRNRFLLFAAFLILISNTLSAQIVGVNCFLQGAYLEIGMCVNSAFGTNSSPVGYHPHLCCTASWTTGVNLAEVYDYGHDGWSVGTPPLMGDYTYPGSPFEGWEIQMNGQRCQQYASPAYSFTPYSATAGAMSGTGWLSYSNTGGVATGVWAGTYTNGAEVLYIKQSTSVDTLASAVVVTTTLYNTGATAIPGVYYMRTCDPDNDETWPGGCFTTDNVVNYQDALPDHKVMVTATGTSATHPPLSLCTKDCRAVAFIYDSWGLTVSQDLGAVWSQTYGPAGSGAFYDVGVLHVGDIGIGIVYNLGTIAPAGSPGDSAVISYAYVFNGTVGIDDPGALPDPVLSVNGVAVTSFPDTLNACSFPGIDSLPVDILHGADKDWSWSQWNWAPATGLATTTGVNNYLLLNELPGDITYTVTGTDSIAGTMLDCNHVIFIFTVHSCHDAWNNSPCFGDKLQFGMKGDSTFATYYWYGPGGFTSSLHDPSIFPATFADTGFYTVVRTIGGVNDTDSTHVIIHPLPVLNVSSNQALCGPIVPTLDLFVNPDSTGEQFSWVGPNGFTSSLEYPVRSPFDSTDAGTYVVNAVTVWGCRSTASINIYPGPSPAFSFTINRGCIYDTVSFIDNTTNANGYSWNFGDGDMGYPFRNTGNHIYFGHQVWYVTLIATNPYCTDSITQPVNTTHSVTAQFTPLPDTICFAPGGVAISFINSSTATAAASPYDTSVTSYHPVANAWSFGDGGTDAAVSPSHTYMAPGAYAVKLVVTDSIPCMDSVSHPVYVIQLGITSISDTTLCISQPFPLTNTVTAIPDIGLYYTYNWTPSTGLNDASVQIPTYYGLGINTFSLTVNAVGLSYNCTASDTIRITSVLGKVLANVTASDSINYGTSIQLNADSEVYYLWKPNDGSLNNNNINDPIATPLTTTTYTVYGFDVNGCLDSAYVTIYVNTETTEGVPSAFTPNNDGRNDVLKPIGPKFFRMLEFRIFNRYGEEIFYSNNKDVGWDGTYHNVPQDMGTYFYQIIVVGPDGQNVVYKGDVTLIR